MKERDKFIKLVEWSDEDDCYVGSIPGFIGPCCHGADEEKVYHELIQILDEWIEIYQKDGKPLPEGPGQKHYSGKFVLRVGEDLHKAIALKAIKSDKSINAYVKEVLRKELV